MTAPLHAKYREVPLDAHDAMIQFDSHFGTHTPLDQWQQLQHWIKTYGLAVGNTPLKSSPKPLFMSHQDRSRMANATTAVNSIVDTVARLLLTRDDVAIFLGFNKIRHAFLFSDCGYSDMYPVVRYDVFYDRNLNQLKFMEFNTHSPSSIGLHDQLVECLKKLTTIRAMKNSASFQVDRLIDGLAETLIQTYRDYCRKKGHPISPKPFIVVMASKTSTVRNDAEQMASLLRSRGMHCNYAYPQQLSDCNGGLALNGEKIDIIYRDAIQDFAVPLFGIHDKLRYSVQYLVKCLVNRARFRRDNLRYLFNDNLYVKAMSVTKACRLASVCVVNPAFSYMLSSKLVLALLHDHVFRDCFTQKQRSAIRKYIPWTHVLKPGSVHYEDKTIDIIEFVKSNKDRFVIKPALGYGGYGVAIGCKSDQKAWNRRVENTYKYKRLDIVQDLLDIPEVQFPELNDDGSVGYQTSKINLNLWSFSGRFLGAFVRASKGPVINLHAGGMLVPVFYV